LKLKIKEVEVKDIVVKSNLPKAPYVANPYTGCHFGCVYCYADFMRKWSGHSEEWGQFVDVKINSPSLAENQNHGGKDVLFSSVTDPYQPLESRYKLTRQILDVLSHQVPQPEIGILTKSVLVVRDVEILKRFRRCTVGFSFSTLDDRVRKILEPVTPPIKNRVEAVKRIHDEGVRTYVFISPIMPYLTAIEEMVSVFKPYADYFMFENLNVRPNLWKRIRPALGRIDATLIPRYEEIYFTETGTISFWEPIRQEIYRICEREKLEPKLFFHHA
jgi:DNA repair photolyase